MTYIIIMLHEKSWLQFNLFFTIILYLKELTVQNNASFEQSKSRSPRTKRGKLERKVNDTYRTSKVLKTSKVELFQNTLLTNHVDLNKDASELTDKLF